MDRKIKAVVLAAGKGTRLHSAEFNMPKVMRTAAGRPLLGYVLRATDFIPPRDTVVVVGYMKEKVMEAFPEYVFAEQAQQLGTGHAVACAKKELDGFDGDVLVCYGDMPLMEKQTYVDLVEEHRRAGNDCTLLSGTSDEELPYGRVLRKADGSFDCVVEDKDCTPEQKKIRELNAGIYVFDCGRLMEALGELKCANAQGEYYLTDVPRIIMDKGGKVGVHCGCDGREILGVNTPQQLEQVERYIRGNGLAY